jgi:histone H3/H4
LVGIGIETEERETFIDFSDLDYTDADMLLIRKNTIKRLLKDFITDCYESENKNEKELLDNVIDVFESVSEEYINITA